MSYLDDLTPSEDGIKHINIYSKGQTLIGKLLSNFAYTPFICEHGRFASVEGYWYWLGTQHPRREELRHVYGFPAKQLGRELRGDGFSPDASFRRYIRQAISAKIEQNSNISTLLKASTLPFKHYYIMGGKVIPVQGVGWMLDYIEAERRFLQENK